MKKIKDRVLLGTVTGLISAVPGRLLNGVEYRWGLTEAKYGQLAATLFLGNRKVNTTQGMILGSVVNGILTATTGLAVTYLLSATGRDKAALKGLGVGTLYWLALHGLAARGLSITIRKPLTPLLSLADHAIFGTLCGLSAASLGDDSLFPDQELRTAEQNLPLISS